MSLPPHDVVDVLPEPEEVPIEDAPLLPPLPTTCELHACSKVEAMEELTVVRSLEIVFHVLVIVDILLLQGVLVVALSRVLAKRCKSNDEINPSRRHVNVASQPQVFP